MNKKFSKAVNNTRKAMQKYSAKLIIFDEFVISLSF